MCCNLKFTAQLLLQQSTNIRHMYEAYVKSKSRYKIYLTMNDVTSMLYVSLVRQFETQLFYVVTSRIEALVSRHKFLNACVDKVYRLLLQPIVYCRFHLCIWMELLSSEKTLHVQKQMVVARREVRTVRGGGVILDIPTELLQ